jgi:hypothetical protein
MQLRILLTIAAAAALALPLSAQPQQRRAVLTGGYAGGGQCSGEVVVDGAAEINIRGDRATLRDLSGRNPEWRNFRCTSALPLNPGSVTFNAEGRGRAQLVQSPQQGGDAVIRIEDPHSGAQIYRFNLSWNENGNFRNREQPNGYYSDLENNPAVRECESAIRSEAAARFNTRNVDFRRLTADNNQGRREFVSGTLSVPNPNGPDAYYHFSCSMNLRNGRIRSANIDQQPLNWGPESDYRSQAVDSCQNKVAARIRNDGYSRPRFQSTNIDNRQGPNDRVYGTVVAQGVDHARSFDYSCSVNLRNGNLRSANVQRP